MFVPANFLDAYPSMTRQSSNRPLEDHAGRLRVNFEKQSQLLPDKSLPLLLAGASVQYLLNEYDHIENIECPITVGITDYD